MRILFLNDSDVGGGAMQSAFRLMLGLREQGHAVRMLVRDPVGNDPDVQGPRSTAGRLWMRMRRRLDQWQVRRYRQRDPALFSTAWLPDGLEAEIASWRPDVVHLHWINNGFVGLETLAKLPVPVVWTAHDSWMITGGCHFHARCDRFLTSCGACPALGSHVEEDLSRQVWQRKERVYARIRPTVIAPSSWMAQRIRLSLLGRHLACEVIGNPIDRAVFLPGDQAIARKAWQLPTDRKLVLFSALHHSDHNKGLHLLAPAMRVAIATDPRISLVAVGNSPASGMPDMGTTVHVLPPIASEVHMASLIQAMDVVAVPSLCENLPFAILEAQACGVVPVAFSIGGIPDLVDHRRTGWLAPPYDPVDFAAGIVWACSTDSPAAKVLSAATESFGVESIVHRHLAVYESLSGKPASLTSDDDSGPGRGYGAA